MGLIPLLPSLSLTPFLSLSPGCKSLHLSYPKKEFLICVNASFHILVWNQVEGWHFKTT